MTSTRWTFSVEYWEGQDIWETTGAGATKTEALENFFRQYRAALGFEVNSDPIMPSDRDIIGIQWQQQGGGVS